MKLRFLVSSIIALILGAYSFSLAQEEITITTYYPSPQGVYRNLRVSDDRNLLKTNDTVPSFSVENLPAGSLAPIWIEGQYGYLTEVCADNFGNPLYDCTNPVNVGCVTERHTTIVCGRGYEPAMTSGQVNEWAKTSGRLALLSYAFDTDHYRIDPDRRLSWNDGNTTNLVKLPWAPDQIAVLGVSNSVGLYGMSVGAHPGVYAYSARQYGLHAKSNADPDLGDNDRAAVFGQGGRTASFLGVNIGADDATATFRGINYGAGPIFGGWKGCSGAGCPEESTGFPKGGPIAVFDNEGSEYNDYGLVAQTEGGVAIHARSSGSTAIFATDNSSIFFDSAPGWGTIAKGSALTVVGTDDNKDALAVTAKDESLHYAALFKGGKGIRSRVFSKRLSGTFLGGYGLYVSPEDDVAFWDNEEDKDKAIARFINGDGSSDSDADGILIKIKQSAVDSKNRFIDFQNNGGSIGSIHGHDSCAGVVYATPCKDYAEYFEAEEDIPVGYLVGLNLSSGKVRKYINGDPLIGIVSSSAGFVGNDGPERRKGAHVLVGLVGQLVLNDPNAGKDGRLVKTADGKRVGYLLSDGKVYISLEK